METPCNPKRSPLSEMTCPASSTAEVACHLLSPQRYLAVFIYTVVQVDSRIRVSAREHKTQPGILAGLVGFQGFLKCAPRE